MLLRPIIAAGALALAAASAASGLHAQVQQGLPPLSEPTGPAQGGPPVTIADIAIGPSEPRDATPVTDCDRLVASPSDWEIAQGVAGRSTGVTLVRARVEHPCRAALAAHPNSRRLKFLLARVLGAGVDFELHTAERRSLLIDAVRGGSLDALVLLGYRILSEGPRPSGIRRAVALFEEASNRGNPAGFVAIGFFHRGIENYKDMNRWYQRAAEAGSRTALIYIGDAYRDGHGVPKDYEQARQYYQRAVQAGDPGGYVSLGNLIYQRDDGQKDAAQMIAWFEKGADAGNAQAGVELAEKYQNGYVVEKNLDHAERWFERSLQQGYALALWGLAQVAASRSGGESKAIGHLDRMRDYGVDADFYYYLLYYYGSFNTGGLAKDPEKAFAALRRAVERAPNPFNLKTLAGLYERGEGTAKNLEEARRLYERAAALNNGYAWDLARFHLDGLGGLRADAGSAAGWMLVALVNGEFDAKWYLLTNRGQRAIQRGDTHVDLDRAAIAAIQQKLRALGLLFAAPTGVVDDDTQSALRLLRNPFQTDITNDQILAAR